MPKVKEICVSCQLMNSLFRDTGPKSAGTFMLHSQPYRQKATDSRVGLGRDHLEKVWHTLFCFTFVFKFHDTEQRISKYELSFLQASQHCSPTWCTSKCGSWFMIQLPLATLHEQVHQESPASLFCCSLAVAIAHCGNCSGPACVLQPGVQSLLGSAQSSCCSCKCCCCGPCVLV